MTKDAVIILRVTTEEHELLHEHAKFLGISASELIRRMVNAAINPRAHLPPGERRAQLARRKSATRRR